MRNSLSFNETKNVIDVLFSYNGRDDYAHPVRLTYNAETYFLGGVQFWYVEDRVGVRVHHYRVSDEHGEYIFELSLETENLTWTLDSATQTGANRSIGSRLIGVMS